MPSQALQPRHPRPRDAVALVRLVLSWLLVAVLAIDLVTSPLHSHRHDGEWTAGATLLASSVHAGDPLGAGGFDGSTHVDHDEAPGLSHSISALRSSAEGVPDVPAVDATSAAAPWFVAAPASPGAASATLALAWPPDRQRAGPPAFKSLPPHGRAPPLHA